MIKQVLFPLQEWDQESRTAKQPSGTEIAYLRRGGDFLGRVCGRSPLNRSHRGIGELSARNRIAAPYHFVDSDFRSFADKFYHEDVSCSLGRYSVLC
jgi:hypothetical protein